MRIAATAQTEYRRMYDELQWLRNRASQEKLMTKVELYRKLTPWVFKLISDLKAILSTLNWEREDLPITKSLKLLPQTFDDYMSQNKIFEIKTLWESPDATYHEVLMSREINEWDTTTLNKILELNNTIQDYSGKIIQELEAGYYIIEWEIPYIIKAAKVVVWV
jgi:molecular chaperone GrpE (heat shock protein)